MNGGVIDIVRMRAVAVIALCCVWNGALRAEPEVGVSPVPGWADAIAIEEFSIDRGAQFQFGMAYLLSDRQVRKTGNGFDYVERLAYQVVERSGLETAATIAREFDPEHETLSFNFLRVLRDGEIIDRLNDAEITLLRQEEGLGANIIDGYYTAVIHLEDIRVGDVIDYSYSGSVESSLWPDHLFESASVEWPMPLAQVRLRLLVPEDLPMTARAIGTQVQPSVSTSQGWTTYEVRVRDPDPIPELQSPLEDSVTYGFILFSTMEEWSNVVDWAAPLFAVDGALPGEFVARLDEIAAKYGEAEDRALQALRLVQEDIRYLGLEVGLGSHVPRPPAVTLERGYGDCKDKAVLLVTALDYLGIAAVPALANPDVGKLLPELSPMIDSFNHVIVRIDVGDSQYWVDPTITHQGGRLDTLAPLGYGYVLPVQEGQAQLVEIELPLSESPRFETEESYEVLDAGDVGLRLSVLYTHRGASADTMRQLISSASAEQLARGFLDYYAGHYPGLTESRPLQIDDDAAANVISFRAGYQIDMQAFENSDLGNKLPIHAAAVQDIIPRQVEAGRVAPLALPYGTHVRHLIRIHTPGRRMPLPQDKSRSVAGIEYTRKFGGAGDVLEIDYLLAVNAEAAGATSLRAVTDLGDEIVQDSELSIYVSRATPSLASRLGLEQPLDPEIEAAIDAIETRIDDEELVQALTALNKLLADHEDPSVLRGYLQLLRGRLLVELDRGGAALQPMQEGIALFPGSAQRDYFAYIGLLWRHGDDVEVVQAIQNMFDRHPTAIDDLRAEWLAGFLRDLWNSELKAERESLLLATARAIDQTRSTSVDDYRWVFAEAVEILARRGEVSDASRFVAYVKDPEALAELLAKRETESIWNTIEDLAGGDLSGAIAEYVDYTRDAAEQSPDDYDRIRRHIRALRIAGRSQDGVDFGAAHIDNWAQIEAVGDDAYWFVNEYAYALSSTGQLDEALDLMGRLVSLGIRENGQLISMAINRIGLLLLWGRFEAALDAIAELEDLDDDAASDYGWMWVYESKACALHRLGRTADASAVLRESIEPLADQNRSAHTKALLCLDDIDAAARIVIAGLDDEQDRDAIILSYMDAREPEVIPPLLLELRARANEVRSKPGVLEQFNKVARTITFDGVSPYWGTF